MVSQTVSLQEWAEQVGALLEPPEISTLIADPQETHWTGRPGCPLRLWPL